MQLAIALFGFSGVIAYYFYFRKRIDDTRRGNPPQNSNMAMLNVLVGIPTAWIWFVMPLLPQPRFAGIVSWIRGKEPVHAMGVLNSAIGIVMILFSAYYLAVVEKANLQVTQKNYTAPEKLLTTGIYGVVRHPIVTFTTFLLLGICMLSGAYYSTLFIPVFFSICYCTSLIEEKYALQVLFPIEFSSYRKSTPAYFNGWLAGLLMLAIILFGLNYFFVNVS
jgi:protein-S-isoprenylcysteine O-methyltransferase Ste14